ncbi:MAG: ABC transporter permease, partial [Candidatus Sumerlaeia bacterium]|nr:ABC transporter permease [Candidatus Sumerlaeia bacterium]
MLRLKIEKRTETSAILSVLIPGLSLLLGLGVVSCVFFLKGANPLFALQKIFIGSFGSIYGLKETITKAIPLILISSGLALAFRAGFWNIGAEGQLLCGAIFATYIGLNLGAKLPPFIIISLMFLAGFIGGGICGYLAVFLKCKFRINEVISTLMLNYIIAELVQYLIYGPWKGATQFGFPYTDNLPPSATLPLIHTSRIHYPTLILAIVLSIIVYILLMRTK